MNTALYIKNISELNKFLLTKDSYTHKNIAYVVFFSSLYPNIQLRKIIDKHEKNFTKYSSYKIDKYDFFKTFLSHCVSNSPIISQMTLRFLYSDLTLDDIKLLKQFTMRGPIFEKEEIDEFYKKNIALKPSNYKFSEMNTSIIKCCNKKFTKFKLHDNPKIFQLKLSKNQTSQLKKLINSKFVTKSTKNIIKNNKKSSLNKKLFYDELSLLASKTEPIRVQHDSKFIYKIVV